MHFGRSSHVNTLKHPRLLRSKGLLVGCGAERVQAHGLLRICRSDQRSGLGETR